MYNKDIYPALQTFGIEHLRDEQERALTPILAGRDVLVRLRTGGGKSLLYQLPALLEGQVPFAALDFGIVTLVDTCKHLNLHLGIAQRFSELL